MAEAAVDQIVLARAPTRARDEAVAAGFKKLSAEVAIAYDSQCVTGGPAPGHAPAKSDGLHAGDDAGQRGDAFARPARRTPRHRVPGPSTSSASRVRRASA